MLRFKRSICIVLAICSLITIPVFATSDNFISAIRNIGNAVYSTTPQDAIKTISLTVGNNESSRNITWYSSDSSYIAQVDYGKKSGDDFPSEYNTVNATVTDDTIANGCSGYKYCTATLTNLLPSTEYVYRLKNGNSVSEIYSFSTKGEGDFSFIFLSDPQIGASGVENSDESIKNDGIAWENAINKITNHFEDAHFIISGGDQVNNGGYESQYAQFFAPDIMSSITLSAIAGNHDDLPNYSQHFNNPNSSSYGSSAAGEGDFWYVYNDVLFLNLNTNSENLSEHKAFLEDAVAQNPHVLWKVVVFHHSIFSTTYHSTENNVVRLREFLVPLLTELDIDAVFMGHDHIYVRSYMMNLFTPDRSAGVQSSVTDPTGILYITSGSVTGSKYYNVMYPDAEYVAVTATQRPTFSNVEISSASLKVSTYYVDDMSLVDEFEIKKSVPNTLEHAPRLVAQKNATCTEDGNKEYYACDCGKYYEDITATKEITDKSSVVIKALNHKNSVHIPRVPANCTADGNIEHWYCPDCNGYYSDSECSQKIDTVKICSRGGHSGGEIYYNDDYHWTICEHCAEPYNREKHSNDCDCKIH